MNNTMMDWDLRDLGQSAFNTIRRNAIKNARRRGMADAAANAPTTPAANGNGGGILSWLRGMSTGKKVLASLAAGTLVSWALDAKTQAQKGGV